MNIIEPPKRSRAETEELDRILRYAITRDQMARFNAELRAAQIAAVERKLSCDRYGPLGECVAVVDPDVYFKWMLLNDDPWRDKKFVRDFARDNPACRAAKPPRRIFNGFSK